MHSNGSDPDSTAPEQTPSSAPAPEEHPMPPSGLGSGLLAQQPTPDAEDAVAVARVCPQCGTEYETGDRFCPKDGTPLRPKAGGDPLIGRVIADRYLVLALIGEGGMGRVYLAEHVKMNRQCAIKVMSPSLIHDTESLQRFAREASSAARILHPNVAAVFDYGEADKIVYLVMEYVDGDALSLILARERQLDPRRAIDIARQIADGLHAAHELGIVHRDLKPDNIIITRNKAGKEIPKVVDFGIAKALTDAKEDALTRSGLVIGTPEYMSPEQLLGDPVDARADIYSLGCIFYQMLTGEPAFAAESREQMIRRRLHEPPPHVRDILPTLPRRLDTLIAHMLARSPGDRLASAAEARDALDPALVLGGWDPGSISSSAPLATLGVYRDDPSLQPTIPMPKVTTSPKRIAIGSVIGSVLLLAGIWVWRATQSVPEKPVPQTTTTTAAVAPPSVPAPIVAESAKTPVRVVKPDTLKPKPAATPAPVSAFDVPIKALADAIHTGDIEKVKAAFPGMTPDQQKSIEAIFTNARRISAATGSFKPISQSERHAEGTATINVSYTAATDLTRGSARLSYHAAYDMIGGTWTLKSLTPP